ncbi:MAG: hypothetical protein HEQ22_07380 [Sphingopyxis sp.]|uniref:hypothetical protein n=1 Tax=Sphingopyxis sp. TaxID=1908224 RepID=UPI003D80DE65
MNKAGIQAVSERPKAGGFDVAGLEILVIRTRQYGWAIAAKPAPMPDRQAA